VTPLVISSGAGAGRQRRTPESLEIIGERREQRRRLEFGPLAVSPQRCHRISHSS
jgi:hypothetical protein